MDDKPLSPNSNKNLIEAKNKGGFDNKSQRRRSITKLNRADSPDPIDMKSKKASQLSLFKKKQFKSGASLHLNPIPVTGEIGKKAKSPKKKKTNNLVGDNLSSDDDGRGAYHIHMEGTERGSDVKVEQNPPSPGGKKARNNNPFEDNRAAPVARVKKGDKKKKKTAKADDSSVISGISYDA